MDEFHRCYNCFRPRATCFCKSIPAIDNRTEVLLVQHRRERFHRFNTARIVHKALRNSQLLTDRTQLLAERLQVKPQSGLLYPGPAAIPMAALPPELRPQQLVVVDGTWHQTKTLVRDIPALQRLPRYQIAPAVPSRYRIRRVPDAHSLSTVEATVAALRFLEPETTGFEQLLQAFDSMVDAQLAHPGSANGSRFVARGSRTIKNVPLALHGDLANIVVAYGEAPPGERGAGKRPPGPPLCWVAQRLGDGAGFGCTLIPDRPLDEAFLGHLELTKRDFAAAISLQEARQRWAEFQRPGDVVAMLQPGTARLFSFIAPEQRSCLVLKAIDLDSLGIQVVDASLERSQMPPVWEKMGRASRRLRAAMDLVREVNALVSNR